MNYTSLNLSSISIPMFWKLLNPVKSVEKTSPRPGSISQTESLELQSLNVLGIKDVFLNITGGIKPDDAAIDLAVICSIFSSDQNNPIPMHTCFAAEVGLSGEIRAVNRIDQRISEAEKLGYKQIIISKFNKFNSTKFNIEIQQCAKIEEVFQLLF